MKKPVNVILIDDNEIDIVVNTKLLKIGNFTDNIISFKSCKKLFHYLDENRAALKESTNILLIDIQMPVVSGFECLSKIQNYHREFHDEAMIFMLSSSIDRRDIGTAEANASILKVLEKPLDVYLLSRLIEAYQP